MWKGISATLYYLFLLLYSSILESGRDWAILEGMEGWVWFEINPFFLSFLSLFFFKLREWFPSKSSTYLAAYTITILLTLFPVLYFTSLWLFCNCHFVLLNLFTFSANSQPHSHLATISLFSASISFCLIYCFLDSTYKQNHMVFVFLWLIT